MGGLHLASGSSTAQVVALETGRVLNPLKYLGQRIDQRVGVRVDAEQPFQG